MLLLITSATAIAQTRPFDGRPWNISTGNLSVVYIQASPVGAAPRPGVSEPPPTQAQLKQMKDNGLVAYEDYVAWGAVEREPGTFDWTQHDGVRDAMKQAGLKYVIYNWAHFPPTWLRDERKSERTLMRCLEHGQETNYLSILDPKTIEWYDHFYRNVRDHFGDDVDDLYACILGPYGEGNYPLNVPDWINIGHCHEGYWCGDAHAAKAFRTAMAKRYASVGTLNAAWGTSFASFDEVAFPEQIKDGFKPTPAAFPTAHDKRRWLDFITWYHQALIDFAERSIETVLKYYPKEKVRTKPGGTAHGINPLAWGTYSPGYAKMAAPYGIVLQPADCIGAVFGDKWLATAYDFYGVTLGTEPAGWLDEKTFVRRMFSDAACGASQLFVASHTGADRGVQGYQEQIPQIRKYIDLYTGTPGDTDVAVLCPTTFYRLGGDLKPTIQACYPMRDLCDFDVLDELLIADGALTPDRYRTLILLQPDAVIDQPILDRLDAFTRAGGKLILAGDATPRNVEGAEWHAGAGVRRLPALADDRAWLTALQAELSGQTGVDSHLDGLWTCRRGDQTFIYNSTDKPASTTVDGQNVNVEPHSIWRNR